jgi:hypothetical protein
MKKAYPIARRPYKAKLNQPKILTDSLNWNITEAIHPMISCIKRAIAIALRVSTDVVFCPNHIRVAKPRIDPPNKRADQIAVASGVSPYRLKSHKGNREHDPPKKMAKNTLIIKS